MIARRYRIRTGYMFAAGALLAAAALSGCATLTNAIDAMNKDINTGLSEAAASPKLNFYLFHSMVAFFDAAASQGAAYKPGQGTVWTVTDTNSGSTTTSTLEQALLKQNSDGTAWWRLDVSTSDGSYLYEYLVASDHSIDKVRYRDPSTGKIEEFVPDRSKEHQATQRQPPAASSQAPSDGTAANGDKVTVTKNRQTITVEAGTFATDHVTYTDETEHYRDESWTSSAVPGALVKFVDTNTQTGKAMSRGELTKIESGVATVLNSY